MRDIKRIDKFLVELGDLWKKYCPDQRFGQFLINFITRDPFYLEEDDFIEMIRDNLEDAYE